MTKKLKEMIDGSLPYETGKPLRSLYIISTGRLYNGFWGKAGFNGIIVIGTDASISSDKRYLINAGCEVDLIAFDDEVKITGMDIPHDKNCINVGFDGLVCFKEISSTMRVIPYMGNPAPNAKWEETK